MTVVLTEAPTVWERISTYITNTKYSPDEIADEILKDLDPSEYESALRALLRGQIVVEMASRRRNATESIRTVPHNGAKRESIRKAFLNQRVHTSTGMKPIGDLTYDDVIWIAESRYELAAATKATGDRYMELGRRMISAQANYVRELDTAVIQEAFA